MKGVRTLRPVKPKYCSTWDVDIVLRFVISLGDNTDLSIMDLTQKTVFLLAMASAHRGKELSFLKIHLMSLHNLYIRFQFEDKFKVQGQSDPPKETFFHRFEGEVNLCPVATLKVLLDRTREFRVRDCITGHCRPTQVILSTKKLGTQD